MKAGLPKTPAVGVLPRVHFPWLIEASADKAVRRGTVWDLLAYPGVLEPLESQTTAVTRNSRCLKPLFNENRKRPFPGWFSSVRNIEDNFSKRRNLFLNFYSYFIYIESIFQPD